MFEVADGGILFLDEIGEMSLDLQASLLRILEDGEVVRVGGNEPKKVDVRIISATNKDLMEMLRQGTFRRDLFYRLNTTSIYIPPLRERRDGIPGLARKALSDLNEKYEMHKELSDEYIKILETMD